MEVWWCMLSALELTPPPGPQRAQSSSGSARDGECTLPSPLPLLLRSQQPSNSRASAWQQQQSLAKQQQQSLAKQQQQTRLSGSLAKQQH